MFPIKTAFITSVMTVEGYVKEGSVCYESDIYS